MTRKGRQQGDESGAFARIAASVLDLFREDEKTWFTARDIFELTQANPSSVSVFLGNWARGDGMSQAVIDATEGRRLIRKSFPAEGKGGRKQYKYSLPTMIPVNLEQTADVVEPDRSHKPSTYPKPVERRKYEYAPDNTQEDFALAMPVTPEPEPEPPFGWCACGRKWAISERGLCVLCEPVTPVIRDLQEEPAVSCPDIKPPVPQQDRVVDQAVAEDQKLVGRGWPLTLDPEQDIKILHSQGDVFLLSIDGDLYKAVPFKL